MDNKTNDKMKTTVESLLLASEASLTLLAHQIWTKVDAGIPASESDWAAVQETLRVQGRLNDIYPRRWQDSTLQHQAGHARPVETGDHELSEEPAEVEADPVGAGAKADPVEAEGAKTESGPVMDFMECRTKVAALCQANPGFEPPAVLAEFGVAKLSQVPEDRRQAFYQRCLEVCDARG